MKPISIVLATYNGEKYISEQLDSILNSAGFDELIEEILVRDDGSTDNTIEILKKYSEHYSVLKIIYDNKKGLGAKENFAEALKYAKTSFVMTCDQDDFWDSCKIRNSFDSINELHKKYPICLVFSDLEIVDSNLSIMHKSFFEAQKINSRDLMLNRLLVSNVAPGCACIFSKELLEKSFPIPKEACMHDWWLMLIAAKYGKISMINESLIKYRQHGNNTVGYEKQGFLEKMFMARNKIKKYKKEVEEKTAQMNCFLEKVGENRKINKTFLFANERTWTRKLLALLFFKG